MTEEQVYKKFSDWMSRSWWGLPESEHLLPTIRAFYTPEEAELLTGLPFSNVDLADLAEKKGLDPKELGARLDALAGKGLVWRSEKDGRLRYKLNDSFFVFMRGPFWAQEPYQGAKKGASPFNKYYADSFMDQFRHVHAKGLRTLPIERTIQDTRQIMPYEDVVQYLDSQDYFTVSNCPCRSRHRLDEAAEVCDHPLEVCLHFGALGHYIVENGLGREITKEEAKDILKQSAEAGLVHGLSNWERGADTICNCCRCNCLFFEAYYKLGHAKSIDHSNYRVLIEPSTCKACGLCAERCPMEALQLEDNPQAKNKKGQAPTLEPELCLGCGVCVYKCPTQSLTLMRREETTRPPADGREWVERYFADRQAAEK